MKFLDLPIEVIAMIIQYLDTQSVHSMYETCGHFRNVIKMQGVVKKCSFSRNILAAVYYFDKPFFMDMAGQLQELSLCGAPDVRKNILLRGMERLKNLLKLDISYTDLNLADFLSIYKACPTIVDITLNFILKKSGLSKLNDEGLAECQNVFKNCKNVHFVGSATNLLYGKLSLLLLKDSNLNTLKFSIAESDRLHTIYVPEKAAQCPMVSFKQFSLYFLDWTTVYAFFGSFFMLPLLAMINLDKVEIIVIIRQNIRTYRVHSTPVFDKLFLEYFDIETEKVSISEYDDVRMGNAVIMIWDKASNAFDEKFFTKLATNLKKYFPYDCTRILDSTAPKYYEWFQIIPTVPDSKLEIPWPKGKKRKAPPEVALNYDKVFAANDNFQLSLCFDEFIINPITLPKDCTYLRKLTYLSLSGSVRLTTDFFEIMFKSCVNLVTLNVDAPALSPCYQQISRYIHHSNTIKNLRLSDRCIDFKLVFDALANYTILESLYIIELSCAEDTNLCNPELIILHCPNLHNLNIQAYMSETACARNLKLINKFKAKLNKYHLKVSLHNVKCDSDKKFYSYDQYVSVFNLNPIKLNH